jgi:hypothetical protein
VGAIDGGFAVAAEQVVALAELNVLHAFGNERIVRLLQRLRFLSV